MSWVRNLSVSAALAGAAFALVNSDDARADVVVASSGPSSAQYPVGKKLAASEQITLKAGDTVTVLGQGGTRVISGAGSHRVGARVATKRSTFAALTRERSASRVRTGAVRGDLVTAEITRPNIWFIDVTQSGTMCIADPAAAQLWRPGTEGSPTYVVANKASPNHVHVAFAAGQTTAPWNVSQLPLADGANYSITGPSGGPSSEISFVMLASVPANPEDLAAALIEKGCTGQLALLTTALM